MKWTKERPTTPGLYRVEYDLLGYVGTEVRELLGDGKTWAPEDLESYKIPTRWCGPLAIGVTAPGKHLSLIEPPGCDCGAEKAKTPHVDWCTLRSGK